MSRTYMIEGKSEVAFGCDPSFADAPITNLPDNAVKVRVRVRAHAWTQIFVKTDDGKVTCYYGGVDGPGALKLLWPMGVNHTRRIKRC